MNLLAHRDTFGLRTLYYREDGSSWSTKIRHILAEEPEKRALDPEGVKAYLKQEPHHFRTCFHGVHAVPPGHALLDSGGSYQIAPLECPLNTCSSLVEALRNSLSLAISSSQSYALALSGGLDSALLLALLTELTGESVPCYILSTSMPDYDETREALLIADHFKAAPIVVEVNESDFVDILPETIFHIETLIYNLHPVSKYLLANALKQNGIELAITGDGADQVFACAPAANYLPLVGSLFCAAEVNLCTPYLDPNTIDLSKTLGSDPDKSSLREAAHGLLPTELLNRKKTPRYAPPIKLDLYRDQELIRALAAKIGLPIPEMVNAVEETKWVTLALLAEQLIKRERHNEQSSVCSHSRKGSH